MCVMSKMTRQKALPQDDMTKDYHKAIRLKIL